MLFIMLDQPTIRDVARSTGYSTATVSMALRDSPRLPDATRALVRRAAQEMGYRPDPLMASIAARRWRRNSAGYVGSTMAAIVERARYRVRFEGSVGMQERANRLGYGLEVFPVGEYPTGQRLSEVLYNRGILGLLVGQIFTPGFVESFDWSHFSSVAVSEGSYRPPIHLVMPNHTQAVQTAWDQAVRMGCRRIGMAIYDEPYALDFHDRRAAFFERQAAIPAVRRLPVLGLPADSDGKNHQDKIRLLLGNWIQRHRPDVVLGFNEWLIWELRAASVRVPEDVAFISLWNHGRPMAPAGMLLPEDEIGRRAVDWVDSLLRAGERGLPRHPSTMLVDFEWQDGSKTHPGLRSSA